ncbi:hypothetical protein [Gordonia alkanivorans]|uniref:hypothetical protein n=1 Tax=Gordonia alkanivorans TaxID=84096 RepID=UPI0004AD176B|nr:hypothetical protein [Gordonia alkanivorans]
MIDDLPVTVTVSHDGATTQAGFADLADGVAFIHMQARAADAAGRTSFSACTRRGGEIIHDVDVAGRDLYGKVRTALDPDGTAAGFVSVMVAGIDAVVYAHRSCDGDDVLIVGVDADEGQHIRFVVNDGDLVDTTVGFLTGGLNLPGGHGPQVSVTATVSAATAAEARRILQLAACCQPVHFGITPSS